MLPRARRPPVVAIQEPILSAESERENASDPRPAPGRQAQFGPFRLLLDERLLMREDTPIRLGGRALDLLIVLVEQAGTLLGKRELLEALIFREVPVRPLRIR